MKAFVVEEFTHFIMPRQDAGDRFARGLDADRKPQWFRDVALTVMDGLPGQTGP